MSSSDKKAPLLGKTTGRRICHHRAKARRVEAASESTRYDPEGKAVDETANNIASNEPVKIRVLSVGDHPHIREGIAVIIDNQPDMAMAGTAPTGKEGIERFRALRPDATLMDLRLPDRSGIEVLIAIRSEFLDTRIIVLTTFNGDVEIKRALKAGARSYLLKSMPPNRMIDTIRQVNAGRKCVPGEIAAGLAEHLSDEMLGEREVEVLRHLAGGNRNRDIGELLFISEETVKIHLKHIMGKLGASDRTEAVAIAVASFSCKSTSSGAD